MIEDIVNGIWEDILYEASDAWDIADFEEVFKRRWRIIIRKAIAESSCSQAMLEETAVMDR